MAGNYYRNPMSGGVLMGSDRVAGTDYDLVKLGFGDVNSVNRVERTNPLPASSVVQSDSIMYNGVLATVKHAKVEITADGAIVPAIAGKVILVLSLFLRNDTTGGSLRFEDGAGAQLSGDITVPASTQVELPFNQGGWFKTAAGQSLNVNVTTINNVDGFLSYAEV